MIYVVSVVVLLMLCAAGTLAYHNSKLIANRKIAGSSSEIASYVYTVFDHSTSGEIKESNAIPLFQFSVTVESDGAVIVNRVGSTFTLCRVVTGKGEMRLDDAQNWMLSHIKRFEVQGALMEYRSFIHRANCHAEKELIMNLEDAIRS